MATQQLEAVDEVAEKREQARLASPASSITRQRSPNKFGAELPNTRVACFPDNSKVTATAIDIPARVEELSVIKDVEEFATELESPRLRDLNPFGHAYIEIVDTWAVEEPAVGRPECSKRGVRGECLRQKIASGPRRCRTILIHFARIHDLHRADKIRHVCGGTSGQ